MDKPANSIKFHTSIQPHSYLFYKPIYEYIYINHFQNYFAPLYHLKYLYCEVLFLKHKIILNTFHIFLNIL